MSDAFFLSSSLLLETTHTHRHTNRGIMLLLSLNAGPTTTITPETGVAMHSLLLLSSSSSSSSS